MYKNILAATDGSELATRAVEHAAALAKLAGASLTLVYVTPPAPIFATAESGWAIPQEVFDQIAQANANGATAIFEAAKSKADIPQAHTSHISDRQPYEGILEACTAINADIIVMASHGHRGLDRLILGSQATKILSLSTVPVLIVK